MKIVAIVMLLAWVLSGAACTGGEPRYYDTDLWGDERVSEDAEKK